jgi:hypothetical protein
MKIELENALFKKYPEIFGQHKLDMRQTAMCWGVDCGNGWYTIIDTLCRLIQHYVQNHPDDSVEAVQVKEKYGGLRFYISGGDDYVDGLIRFAEELSYMTCEQCGSTQGVTQTKGWVYTLCNQCLFDRDMAQYGGEDD